MESKFKKPKIDRKQINNNNKKASGFLIGSFKTINNYLFKNQILSFHKNTQTPNICIKKK